MAVRPGLFASMTKDRNEVVVEVGFPKLAPRQGGENDSTGTEKGKVPLLCDENRDWTPVEWAFKPGNPYLPPKIIWPPLHMPRLDWRLWFQALASGDYNSWPVWMWSLIIGIMDGNEPIWSLLHLELNRDLKNKVCSYGKGARERLEDEQYSEREVSNAARSCGDESLESAGAQSTASLEGKLGSLKQARARAVGVAPAQDKEDESLVPKIRVLLVRYEFYYGSQDISTTATTASFAYQPRDQEQESTRFWKTTYVRTLLPACTLQQLNMKYDEHVLGLKPMGVRRQGAPSIDTAEDIIKRTLFRGLKAKK